MTQHKNGISTLVLRRQLGVSYNTAKLLKHKLMQAWWIIAAARTP